MINSAVRKIIATESKSGVFLLFSFLFALWMANSSYNELYFNIRTIEFFAIGKFSKFVDDFLMAIFFLMVGLEIKREIVEGELSNPRKFLMPVVGALGGVIIPILIFLSFNHDNDVAMKGWAIPAATDIAFSLAILSLFGRKIPLSLKLFLTTLAVTDDIFAITFVALFYTVNINFIYIFASIIIIILLVCCCRKRYSSILIYLSLGMILWYFMFKSGIHATIAGVILGFCLPIKNANGNKSPLKNLEHSLHPLVGYFILPLFAFINSGINFEEMTMEMIFSNKLSIGIMIGLFIGKQLGVFGFVYAFYKLKLIDLPHNVRLCDIYFTSILTGIGFTMSLFIGNIAFADHQLLMDEVRAGVMAGSLLSMIMGSVLIYFFSAKKNSSL